MDWNTHKQSLVEAGTLNSCFLDAVQDLACEALRPTRGRQETTATFPSRLFDSLLRDVATLCDRMTLYRKEMQELEIQAVKVATDRMVQLKSRNFERRLSELQLGRQLSELRASSSEKVAFKFECDSPLSSGLVSDAQSRVSQAKLEMSVADEQLDLLKARWRLADEVSDEYWARHTTPGNAHNFVERWQWIKQLFQEDAIEAYQKSVSIRNGLRLILNMKDTPEPPGATGENFVNDLTMWIRACFRNLELYEQFTQDFEITIPLVQPIIPSGGSVLSQETFKQAIQSANGKPGSPLKLSFSLPRFFEREQVPRLRALALSFTTRSDIVPSSGIDRSAQRLSYVRLQGTAELPPQSHRGDAEASRPKVYLGNIMVYGSPHSLSFVASKQIQNADISGEWQITLYPYATYQDSRACLPLKDIDSYDITDIRLHLKGLCTP